MSDKMKNIKENIDQGKVIKGMNTHEASLAGQDTLIGGDNDNASDALFGGSGEDVLLGGGGDDTLAGGDASNLYADKELDYLAGGVGHDIYYVSHQDIINDADGSDITTCRSFLAFNNYLHVEKKAVA